MHAELDPVSHAAAILDNLDGDLRLMARLLPIFTPAWTDWYGPAYCSALVSALMASRGEC
jgi:hypothetical protein